ncbi:MAG: hypothetical protein AB2L14_21090 [Candidatus Xenobiia bacterium LiM19]
MSQSIDSPSLTEKDPRSMTPHQRITWFCKRYRDWPLAQAKNTMDRNKKCPKCNESIGRNDFIAFLLIAFTTIESLGKFLSGKPEMATRDAFLLFIEEYMHPDWQKEVNNDEYDNKAKGNEKWYLRKEHVTYAQRFYKNFRCSLVHSMYINKDAIDSDLQTDYFDYVPSRKTHILGIHPIKLLNDLEAGVESYLKDLEDSREEDDISKNFLKEFNHYFGI